jgi:hypothetical protein
VKPVERLRKKKREYLKGKIIELETTIKAKD